MALFEIILATAFIGLISLVGVVFLWINEKSFNKILFWLVSFASGTLLGAAFLDLLPEASEGIGFPRVLEIVLASIVVMFLLEKVLSWHHHHGSHSSEKPVGAINLLGGAFHNFFDGVAIAASFLTSTELGVTTTIAVALHEIPQELSDFSLLVYSGFSKKKALFYNFLSEVLGVIGALSFVYFSSIIEHLEAFGLAFTGGMFVYIATADLLPELNKQEGVKKSLLQLTIILFGIALIKIITAYFAE